LHTPITACEGDRKELRGASNRQLRDNEESGSSVLSAHVHGWVQRRKIAGKQQNQTMEQPVSMFIS